MLSKLETEGQGNTKAKLSVQSLINNHPFSTYQKVIFVICFAIVLLDGFDTAVAGFLAVSMQNEWGITKQALAPVLSAALIGLSIGSLLAGPVADKYGRKLIISISVCFFGATCLASAFVSSLDQLVILRLLTGLGLGAALPNVVTLMSEFCPDKSRSFVTNALFCGFPLGAALGGFISAWMIPNWGWRSVLMAGGLFPLILAILVFTVMPESVKFMVAAGKSSKKIAMILSKITSKEVLESDFLIADKTQGSIAAGLTLMISRPYIIGTLMLWLSYFMGLMIFYSLINWLPILLKDTGIKPENAALISALFPLGGVGAIFFGWLMDRFNANIVVATGYALTAILLYAIGHVSDSGIYLMLCVFAGGIMMNMSQVSLAALAAEFYPTQARVTGISWMLGIGRFGGVAGSFLIADLMRRNFDFVGILTSLSLAGLVAAGALIIKHLSSRSTNSKRELLRA